MESLSIIDLTHTLDPDKMSIYPGDPLLACCPVTTIPQDGYAVNSLSLGTHTGTHIDAPSHFIANGTTIDQIALDMLVARPALVVDLTYKKPETKISWDSDLAKYKERMKEGVILLLYTGWSAYWATPAYMDYPYLDKHAAEQILLTGVKVIGLDTLSPDQIDGDEGYGVHEVILGTGGLIVENLTNLKALAELQQEEGATMVSIVPLTLKDCDGSPVRAFGWKA
ncbi:putative cyclase [Rhodocollybia butyracea]|uniref:Cyclase n=1 Tax=Rhodocollybia butyracea TaxID=206335 RepID=A0A9P5Q518_9AGAR|nr:putative cyclase [Rhodocollybia butyracea]